MKKVLFFLFICLSYNTLSAQEKVLEQNLKLKSFDIETQLLSNPVDNNTAMIIMDKKNIHLQLLDKDFNVIQSLTAEKLKPKNITYINHYYEAGIYHIYFNNYKEGRGLYFSESENFTFHVLSFNTNKETVTLKEFSLPDQDKIYLSSFKRNGKLCLMFVGRKTSRIYFYTYGKEKMIEKKMVDLSRYEFGSYADKNFYQAVINPFKSRHFEGNLLYPKTYFSTLTNDYTNETDRNNSKIKLYPFEDKIILTIDIRKFSTRIFNFSLDDFSYGYKEIKQQKTICDDNSLLIDSNSYLMDGNLFQVSHCKKQMTLSIYNIKEEQLMQSFQAERGNEIPFKNSDFIEDGMYHYFDSKKKISNKAGFNKISKGKVFISPLKVGNEIELTIGAYREINTTRITTDITGIPYSNNPISTVIRSITFKSLIDGNSLEPIKKEAKKNTLDKIEYMELRNEYDIDASDWLGTRIMKYEDYYILGYYLKQEKKFILRKFMD